MNLQHYPILLVEDNSSDVILTKHALKKAKLLNPVQVAKDGEMAVDYLSGVEPYSNRAKYPLPVMILLDLHLPGKSGLEVLAWLRQQPILKDVPVVVLSASNRANDVNRAYDLGISSYVIKPVAFDALLKVMRYLNQYWILLNQPPAELQQTTANKNVEKKK